MSLRVLTRGSHEQIVNGKKIVNKHYGVSMDNNQVNGLVIDKNKQYKFHDSLEHFLKKLSSNKLSMFDLLEQEKSLSNLSNPHYQSKSKSESKSESKSKSKHKPKHKPKPKSKPKKSRKGLKQKLRREPVQKTRKREKAR
jgi:hypothetical protein